MMVLDPTTGQLDVLLALQATDHRIRRLQHQLDDLPEQRELERSGERIVAMGEAADELRARLERAAADQRRMEREIDVLGERRDAEQQRLYDGTVTNQREMQSLEAEIASVGRRVDEHEEELLELLETIESQEGRLAGLESDRVAEEHYLEQVTTDRDDAAKDLLAELAELEVRRDEQALGLPEELLNQYEALARRMGGTGVGRLERNACTACGIDLSMADINDLLTGSPLATCPQCSRLLVVPA